MHVLTTCISSRAQVREKDLSVVITTLEEEFNIYREVGGESVPVHGQEVTNGLQKNGREGRGQQVTVPGGDPVQLRAPRSLQIQVQTVMEDLENS